MFVDQAKIKIESGSGGHGHIGFFRARYVPNGGPNGGDGGNGGSVIFAADPELNTLMDFRYRRVFKGEPGKNGGNNNKSGANGADCIVAVPPGTIIRDAQTGRIIADMAENTGGPGATGKSDIIRNSDIIRKSGAAGKSPERYTTHKVLLKGGKGGRGNQHFATPTRQAPKFAEDGKSGKTLEIILELKLIADAGIIGFPNAGKSTLLAMVTNAKPKIAGYQFTTLSPNLGVVRSEWGSDFVLADIPGLIEGASSGIGLGHDFLRHIERTKVLIHVVDISSGEKPRDARDAVEAINAELVAYNPKLLDRPQIIAANKMDLVLNSEELLAPLYELGKELGHQVFPISAAANDGLKELIKAVQEILRDYPEDIIFEAEEEIYDPNEEVAEAAITVEKDDEGIYRVEGPGIERILGYTNMIDEKGFAYFQRFMREKGIIAKLEELGITEGDTVQMYEYEFDYLQ